MGSSICSAIELAQQPKRCWPRAQCRLEALVCE